MQPHTHGSVAPGTSRPEVPKPTSSQSAKTKIELYVDPRQLAQAKSAAASFELSMSSYLRLCLDIPDEEIELLAQTPAFKMECSHKGRKMLQVRIGRDLKERLLGHAGKMDMSLSSFARGLVFSQRPQAEDGTAEGIGAFGAKPADIIYRTYPDTETASEIGSALSALSYQVRKLGYNVDNCLHALNALKKRKNASSERIESVLETNIARMEEASGIRADIARMTARVEAMLHDARRMPSKRMPR